eukprot:TRINITY_DN77988_c0_g1_i1.p1 TRINITY_DN77988_c0_g1~~TRINITY_DN77988_c0_g1_i1.p1  ORF type:complete len:124 (+),score=5.38 TRINITY_DN77988_c0_g1_i1:253-624(+)
MEEVRCEGSECAMTTSQDQHQNTSAYSLSVSNVGLGSPFLRVDDTGLAEQRESARLPLHSIVALIFDHKGNHTQMVVDKSHFVMLNFLADFYAARFCILPAEIGDRVQKWAAALIFAFDFGSR